MLSPQLMFTDAQVDLNDGVQNDEPVAMDNLQAVAQENGA